MNQPAHRVSQKVAAVPGQLSCPVPHRKETLCREKKIESRITAISLDIYSPTLTDFIRVFLKTAIVSPESGMAASRTGGWLIHTH